MNFQRTDATPPMGDVEPIEPPGGKFSRSWLGRTVSVCLCRREYTSNAHFKVRLFLWGTLILSLFLALFELIFNDSMDKKQRNIVIITITSVAALSLFGIFVAYIRRKCNRDLFS